MLEKLTIIAQQSEDCMFKGFSDGEIETLSILLDKVYANLSNV